MIKKALIPVQIVLLNKRLCPGCTQPLDKLDRKPFRDNKVFVQCKCQRRYILDLDTNAYRRATLHEEKEFLTNQGK